jgi:hypothetical protein
MSPSASISAWQVLSDRRRYRGSVSNSRCNQRGGGSSEVKWRASLSATCAAVAGGAQDREHGAPLLDAAFRIGLAKIVCGPGSCRRALNRKLVAVIRVVASGRSVQPVIVLAKRKTVVLRVDRAHAEGMQFERLAREILIQARSC